MVRDRLNSLEADFAPHVPALRNWLSGQLRNSSDIDDVVQDIWLRLCGRDEGQKPIDNVRSYMFQTARSVLADRHRRASVRLADRHQELTEFDHPVEEVTPERVLMGKQQVLTVSQRIAMLPERTRDIFLLNRFDQMSYRDIAQAMGLSVSAVEKHMMKALRFLMNDEGEANG
ncbi:RNA polymerase sigma factor [Sphingobium sp. TCM1]|uniref:RNA polymerase sigma factor n=1 Tax=Sphingobium sp. TCM1 TaxID=453246 RepID=UPI000A7A5FC0|nr:RNA polymerase sigma factor [Sphingobium sp. TCM1]